MLHLVGYILEYSVTLKGYTAQKGPVSTRGGDKEGTYTNYRGIIICRFTN